MGKQRKVVKGERWGDKRGQKWGERIPVRWVEKGVELGQLTQV